MTAAAVSPGGESTLGRTRSFTADVGSVAIRALKLIPRDPEGVIPALVIGAFFFAVNVGSLESLTEFAAPEGFDYRAFQLPMAIVFSVTGVSRAGNLVIDIQDGYFDRLLMTPMSRVSLLLGLMVSDIVLVAALCVPVILMGFLFGVTFTTGVTGIVVFILIAALWGLAFTGFPYAVALKTGSPAAVNSSFLIFFPFAFLTTAFVPMEALSGWMETVATYNPVTYLLEALRSLIMVGWEWDELAKGVAAVLLVGIISHSMAFAALRGRVKRG